MKNLLLTLTAATAIAAAAPAAAQYGRSDAYGGRNDNFAQRIDQVEDRLEDGIDAGTISRAEARSLRPQIRQLIRLEARYSFDGLSAAERDELRQRLRSIRQELRVADGRSNRYNDWDDEYARDDRYGREGRGRDFREVSQVCFQQASGIQAIFRAMLGADNCLRVGDPVNVNLAAVPAEYGDRFRNTSRTYYRYLEGNVIEIDSRNRVVTRIYEVG